MSEGNEAGVSLAEPASAQPAQPEPQQPTPLRDDMLQNAVAFLTHPKVKDSPEATKRSFLERKGLTTAEVDEAFKHAPAQPPSPPPAAAPASQPVQSPSGLVTYQPQQTQQQQSTTASPQQGALVAPPGYSLVPGLPQQGGVLVPAQPQPQPQPQPVQEPVRWSQVVLGIGVLATGIYAVKSLVYPYVRDAYCSWSERSRAQREAQEQQQRALSELVLTMNACKDELSGNSKRMDQLLELLQAQHAEQAAASRRAESSSLDLTQELASVRTALLQLQHAPPRPATPPLNGPPSASTYNNATGVAHNNPHYPSPYAPPSALASTSSNHRWNPATGPAPLTALASTPSPQPAYSHQFLSPSSSPSNNPRATKSSVPLPPPSRTRAITGGPTASAFPGGYEDILPPPGGFLGGYSGGGVLQGAPWQPPQAQQQPPLQQQQLQQQQQQQQQQQAGATGAQGSAGATNAEAKAPYPPSFMEVMDMVSKGITPPNVRTDIDDKPPDPFRPPSEPRLAPRAKPWEAALAAKPPSPFPPAISPTTAPSQASLSNSPAPSALAAKHPSHFPPPTSPATAPTQAPFSSSPAPSALTPATAAAPAPAASSLSPTMAADAQSSPPDAAAIQSALTWAANMQRSALPGAKNDDGSSLLLSSKDWLGAAADSPEVVRQQQLPPPEASAGADSRANVAGAHTTHELLQQQPQQQLPPPEANAGADGGEHTAGEHTTHEQKQQQQPQQQVPQHATNSGKARGLNAAAEPYAPAWLQQQQQQQQQAAPPSPSMNPIFQGLQRELAGTAVEDQPQSTPSWAASTGETLSDFVSKEQQQQQQQQQQEHEAQPPPPPPPAPRPVSVLQPNPSWKPPPPPKASVTRPKPGPKFAPPAPTPPPTHSTPSLQANGDASTNPAPSQAPSTADSAQVPHPAQSQQSVPPATPHTPPQSASPPTSSSPAPENIGVPRALRSANAAVAPVSFPVAAAGSDGEAALGVNGGESATDVPPVPGG